MRYWFTAVLAVESRGLPGLGALTRFITGLVICCVVAGRADAQPPTDTSPPVAESASQNHSGHPPLQLERAALEGDLRPMAPHPLPEGEGSLGTPPGSQGAPGWYFGPPAGRAEGPTAADPPQPGHLFGTPADSNYGPIEGYPSACPGTSPLDWEPVTCFGLRHSSTDRRNVGRGWPLVGTSWLNRPYFAGASLGTLWMTHRVENSVGRDIDVFGNVFVGWDWDYYWGSEFDVGWATPELINSHHPDALRSDRMSFWSLSHIYYPWGDAVLRPYWRCGIGDTEVSFPADDGTCRHEWLLTFPLGFGVKYPLRHWLATRIEVTDHLMLGEYGVASQNNVTLTFSLECRYGVHPRSYWPWNPSRHIR